MSKLKFIITACTMLLIIQCADTRNPNYKIDVDSVQDYIRMILKSNFIDGDSSDNTGVWKSESSNTLLFIGNDDKVLIMNISHVGNLEILKNGDLYINRTFPELHSQKEKFGALKDGHIFRHNYDYMEVFKKMNLQSE